MNCRMKIVKQLTESVKWFKDREYKKDYIVVYIPRHGWYYREIFPVSVITPIFSTNKKKGEIVSYNVNWDSLGESKFICKNYKEFKRHINKVKQQEVWI